MPYRPRKQCGSFTKELSLGCQVVSKQKKTRAVLNDPSRAVRSSTSWPCAGLTVHERVNVLVSVSSENLSVDAECAGIWQSQLPRKELYLPVSSLNSEIQLCSWLPDCSRGDRTDTAQHSRASHCRKPE